MFENVMKFLKKFIKKDKDIEPANSKDRAKERLHLVLMQDRANVSADFLELMKQEIIEVIKKYIDIDEGAIDVRLTNKENDDGTNGAPALYANIPILNIKNETRKIETKAQENKNEKLLNVNAKKDAIDIQKESKANEKNMKNKSVNEKKLKSIVTKEEESEIDLQKENEIIVDNAKKTKILNDSEEKNKKMEDSDEKSKSIDVNEKNSEKGKSKIIEDNEKKLEVLDNSGSKKSAVDNQTESKKIEDNKDESKIIDNADKKMASANNIKKSKSKHSVTQEKLKSKTR